MSAAAINLAPADFKYVADLVFREAAIVLDDKKSYLVEARLTQLARDLNLKDYNELIGQLRTKSTPQLVARVVDAMTTNETFFFRDAHFYEALKTTIIPELMHKRAATKTLRMWCAACSTGQEPYSLAMMMLSTFPELRNWQVKLIASDISETVLKTARNGIYNQLEINRGLPTSLRDRFFSSEAGNWVAKSELKQWLEFKQVNLKAPFTGMGSLDLIFVRNVLIYFNVETKKEILEKMTKLLQPDGVVFLGASETATGVTEQIERKRFADTFAYVLKNQVSTAGAKK